MSPTIRRLTTVALVLGVCALVGAAPAGALLRRTAPLEELNLPSFPLGPPDGIAIDQETGNVYVGNRIADTIEIFGAHGGSPAGGVPAQITGLVYHREPIVRDSIAQGNQEAGQPYGVAVDNACYYAHLSGAACEAFDPSNGDVYADERDAVAKFKLNAIKREYELVSEFKAPFASGVAVDGYGNVYLVGSDSTVYEFEWLGSSQPKEVRQIPGAISYETDQYVAVAPSGEVLYTVKAQARNAFMLQVNANGEVLSSTQLSAVSSGAFGGGIAVDLDGTAYADNAVNVQEYNAVGGLVEEFGGGLTAEEEVFKNTLYSQGVAVNDESGDVYVVSRAGSVKVYGPPVVLADVTTGSSSRTGPVSAVVSGSIDPDGVPASARFEYGLSTKYGLLAGAMQAAGGPEPGSGQDGTGGAGCTPPGGAGCTPVPVTATLTALEPNALYHYRLDGVNANGVNEGEDGTFTTPPAAPALENESASAVTTTTAILNATVNPNNEPTSYQFEYGQSDAYGTTAPAFGSAGEGYGRVHLGQPVAGLQPGVTYHYRVIAENATGRVAGPDQTFTTAGAPPPLASTGAPASVGSNSALVTGTVDPHGVGTAYRFQVGTDTSYGVEVFGSAGAGGEAVPVSLELESLQPDTTYHYRLVASSEGGISYGADQTFTTGTVPGELLSPPVALPLVATPAVTFPAYEAGAASGKGAGARKKTRHKSRKKKVRKAKKRKAKKAGRAGSGRAAGHRDGRGRGA